MPTAFPTNPIAKDRYNLIRGYPALLNGCFQLIRSQRIGTTAETIATQINVSGLFPTNPIAKDRYNTDGTGWYTTGNSTGFPTNPIAKDRYNWVAIFQ